MRLAGLDDAKPIATEAGRDVAGLESRAESLRDHAQKRVANLATERLIDSLETIEVDCQHGCKVGLATRPVRVVILSAGLLFAKGASLGDFELLEPAIYVMALLTTVTTLQRVIHVRRELYKAAA